MVLLACGCATGQVVEGWAVSLENQDTLVLSPSMLPNWLSATPRYGSMSWTPWNVLWVCGSYMGGSGLGHQFSLSGQYMGASLGFWVQGSLPNWNMQALRDGLLWLHGRENVLGTHGIWAAVPPSLPLTPPNLVTGVPEGLFHDGAAYDGRYLYCMEQVPPAGATSHAIWLCDLRHPTHPQQTILNYALTAPSPEVHRPMTLGPDGNLLVFDSNTSVLQLVDVDLGTATVISPPLPVTDVRSIAYNHWSDTVMVLAPVQRVFPPNPSPARCLLYEFQRSTGQWQLRYTHWGEAGWQIEALSTPPFERFGYGCPNSSGRDPQLGWRGLPRQGQTFGLRVHGAEAGGLAGFWLGTSDTFWPGLGSLPWDASAVGAPGCRLYASSDFSLFTFVDAAGRANVSVAVPVNAALSGLEVYAQSVSTSGGNQLGLAASDALAIRLR